MSCGEKLTEQIKLTVSETMLRDIQDLAMHDDRLVAEYIRHILQLHIYGHARIVRERANKSTD